MSAVRTYKSFLGAFLLALYAFIATPVQFWHHHAVSHAAKQNKQVPTTQYDLLAQADGSLPEANCAICNHQYAAYSEIEIPTFEVSQPAIIKTYGSFQLPVVTAPSFFYSNKGPPVSIG